MYVYKVDVDICKAMFQIYKHGLGVSLITNTSILSNYKSIVENRWRDDSVTENARLMC